MSTSITWCCNKLLCWTPYIHFFFLFCRNLAFITLHICRIKMLQMIWERLLKIIIPMKI